MCSSSPSVMRHATSIMVSLSKSSPAWHFQGVKRHEIQEVQPHLCSTTDQTLYSNVTLTMTHASQMRALYPCNDGTGKHFAALAAAHQSSPGPATRAGWPAWARWRFPLPRAPGPPRLDAAAAQAAVRLPPRCHLTACTAQYISCSHHKP